MREIELTQGQVAFVDDVDYEYLSQWKWCAARDDKNFRAVRHSPMVNGKRKTIQMYRVITERMGIDSKMIDHIDHNPLNNCRSNLRAATNSQNQHNRGAPSSNTTGVKGVSFYQKISKYHAQIEVEGKQYRLGFFDTVAEAKAVVVAKREELVGEFACH